MVIDGVKKADKERLKQMIVETTELQVDVFGLSSLRAFDLPATFCCKMQGQFKLFNALQVSKISK